MEVINPPVQVGTRGGIIYRVTKEKPEETRDFFDEQLRAPLRKPEKLFSAIVEAPPFTPFARTNISKALTKAIGDTLAKPRLTAPIISTFPPLVLTVEKEEEIPDEIIILALL